MWREFDDGDLVWFGVHLSYSVICGASEMWAAYHSGLCHPDCCLTRSDVHFHDAQLALPVENIDLVYRVEAVFRASKSDRGGKERKNREFG